MMTVICQFCGRYYQKEGEDGPPTHSMCTPCFIKNYKDKAEFSASTLEQIAVGELRKEKDVHWFGDGPVMARDEYEIYSRLAKEAGVPLDEAVRSKEKDNNLELRHEGGRRVAA